MARMSLRVVVLLLVLGARAAFADPIDKPFAATPAELIAAAASATETAILLEDIDASFDDGGRQTRRWRQVFVVRSAEDLADWGTLFTTYDGALQDRPAIRA